MQSDFYSSIRDQVFRLLGEGKRRLVLWGFNADSVMLTTELNTAGMLASVVAIIDEDRTKHGIRCFHLEIQPVEQVNSFNFDTIVVLVDEQKEEALLRIAKLVQGLPDIVLAGDAHLERVDELFSRLVASSQVKSKAGGYPQMLYHLYQSIIYLSRTGRHGAVAEFGCFKCGTTIFIARLLKELGCSARVFAFDSFDGYPPRRHLLDMFHSAKCEHRDFDGIQRLCAPYDIELVRGDICGTVARLKGQPLMLSFFDTDNYSPTQAALELCYEQTIPGGILAFDHYHSPGWGYTIGERLAAKEILAGKSLFHLHGTGIFIKL